MKMKYINIKKIISGRIIRKKIMSKDNRVLFLVFPDAASIFSYYGLLYADEYSYENDYNKIIIISSDKTVIKAADFMIDHPLGCYYLNKSKMSDFLYNLSYHINFMGESIYNNVLFISDKYPYGDSTKILCDNGVFSESYYVWNRIYNKKKFYRSHEPSHKDIIYNGEDKDVLDFLNQKFT